MNAEGVPLRACFTGLMLTPRVPGLWNTTPEFWRQSQAILSMLETDPLEIFEAVIDEKLADIDIK